MSQENPLIIKKVKKPHCKSQHFFINIFEFLKPYESLLLQQIETRFYKKIIPIIQ